MEVSRPTLHFIVLVCFLAGTSLFAQTTERHSGGRTPELVYPVLQSGGNQLGAIKAYEKQLQEYDIRKQSLITKSMSAGNTDAYAAPAPARTSKNKKNILQSANCIIPHDNSWTPIPRNDDGSYGPISLPFTFDLYGTGYTNVWINTNGNLTFTGQLSAFTPSGLPIATPMVAPFWADIDTRSCGGQIYFKLMASRLMVTWDNVGFYYQNCSLVNTFQVIIGTYTDPVIGIGNNVQFNYGDMQWTTGDASGGIGGFGGSAATAGINKGNGIDFVQIGRFSLNSSAYDGPGGADDGVNYIDDRCYGFNVSTAANLAPFLSGMPPGDAVSLEAGQTVHLSIQGIPPEITQTNTMVVSDGGLCNVSSTITNGAVATADISITGAACNLGTNIITVSATDDATVPLTTSRNISVTVTCPALAFTMCPTDIITSTDAGVCSALVSYVATAASSLPVTYSYSFSGAIAADGEGTGSGANFAKGFTKVTVTASNGCSTTSCSFLVTVIDMEAPIPNVTTLPTVIGECSASVATPTASDNCLGTMTGTTSDPVTYTTQGTFTVNWSYDDGAGNTSSQAQTVIVKDATAPDIVLNPSITLWPANHQYQTVTMTDMIASIADNCASLTPNSAKITSVYSDEPEDANGNGDGNTLNDIVIASSCNSVQLRREREGSGNGRVYTVNFKASDGNGNTSVHAFKVRVPHDQNSAAIDDGPATGYTVLSSCNTAKQQSGSTTIPAGYALDQNYPNPFNPTTTISFTLPRDAHVLLSIFDLFGRKIAVILDGTQTSGQHNVVFDASGLATGTYVYTLESDGIVISKSMNLLK